MNISDRLLQKYREHYGEKAQIVSSRSKKRFLYFINSYGGIYKKQKANVLISCIQESAHWQFKKVSTLFYLNNQVSGYTPEFSRIRNLQSQLTFVIFHQFVRTGRMSSQQLSTFRVQLDFFLLYGYQSE